MPTPFENFVEEIEVTLGGNLVSVELEEIDYKTALKRAIRKFKQYGANNYQHGFVKVTVDKGQDVIELPANTDTVVKILRPMESSDFFSSEDLFVRKAIDEMFISRGRMTSCNGFNFLHYEMLMQEQERLRRYSANDVDFNFNRFGNPKTITVFNKPRMQEDWYVELYMDLEEEQYMTLEWVVQWALSECMMILGRAYSKFSGGIAGPNSDVQLDGRSMIQEAQELQRTLMEDAQMNMSGDVDFYQVRIG